LEKMWIRCSLEGENHQEGKPAGKFTKIRGNQKSGQKELHRHSLGGDPITVGGSLLSKNRSLLAKGTVEAGRGDSQEKVSGRSKWIKKKRKGKTTRRKEDSGLGDQT